MSVKPQLSDELARIPKAAKILAALVPVCVLGVLVVLRTMSVSHSPASGGGPTIAALALMIIPLLAGVLFAIWILLVGYVYADSGRRGMSRLLWMLVVIFVPNALGFILYFLLRHPVLSNCPGCGVMLNDDVAYCPQCGAHVANSCPQCGRLIGLTDRFCSGCGHDLKSVAEQPG